MTTSMKLGTAGIVLAIATCCGAPGASAQLYFNVGGSDSASSRNQSITNNLGIGGPGSATEVQSPNQPLIGSNRGMGFPLLNQQSIKPLGVNGNPAGAGQGSLSSASDRASSPVDSVTNSLMGPVGNLVSHSTNAAPNPAAKRKQTKSAAAASSSSGGTTPQATSAKSP